MKLIQKWPLWSLYLELKIIIYIGHWNGRKSRHSAISFACVSKQKGKCWVRNNLKKVIYNYRTEIYLYPITCAPVADGTRNRISSQSVLTHSVFARFAVLLWYPAGNMEHIIGTLQWRWYKMLRLYRTLKCEDINFGNVFQRRKMYAQISSKTLRCLFPCFFVIQTFGFNIQTIPQKQNNDVVHLKYIWKYIIRLISGTNELYQFIRDNLCRTNDKRYPN